MASGFLGVYAKIRKKLLAALILCSAWHR